LAAVLVGLVVLQWLTREVSLVKWGPWRLGFHRDEWPACYWAVQALELGLAALSVYWSFTWK
jgi:hypothetical protein